MSASYLATGHDPLIAAGSVLIAFFASFVALDLARRVHATRGGAALFWWAGGSLAMGTGVWAMHFVGMLAFEAGIPLYYDTTTTAVSWLAAVAASGVALGCAARERPGPGLLAAGTLSMAAGVCAMHYLGMAALDIAPGIVWHRGLVGLSVLVALGASGAALALFLALRQVQARQRLRRQAAAAVAMGLAICGMHYTAMAAAQLPLGAVCGGVDGLATSGLGPLVAVVTALMLTGTLLTSIHDARRQAREARLARSLQTANAQLQTANEALHRLAFRDALTELPNRLLFDDRLQQAVARRPPGAATAADARVRLAVLFIDLDGFKPINDSQGHAAGDRVLREVAQRLAGVARAADTLARVGGDEFVLLLEAWDDPLAPQQVAQRLIDTLRAPFALDGQEFSLSCSVGIALYPQHGEVDKLLAHADAAMYAAKRGGGSGWALFEAGMGGDAGEQVQLQQALRGALARGELSLQYQPQLRAADGGLHGVEALLRWRHPERGLVSPALFIPVAERFGLIGQLGDWVIDEACAQLGRWNALGWRAVVAINLSPHQLRQADLLARIAAALARHEVAPAQLVCEITETAMMENLQADEPLLARLAASGVTVAIDDFGIGYSSLSRLRVLPARELKIDRSFIADIEHDGDARAVLAAVVGLAHALRMRVVAEGVETAGQRALLTSLGCDLLQGYLMARPMTPAALLDWRAAHAAGGVRGQPSAEASLA